MKTALANQYVPFINTLIDQLDEIGALATGFAGIPACDGALAGNDIPSISAVLGLVADPDIQEYIGLLQLGSTAMAAGALDAGLAGLATTSTEWAMTIPAVFIDGFGDDPGLLYPEELGLLLQLIGLIATNPAFAGCGPLQGDAQAIVGALGGITIPAVPSPVFAAAEDPAKAAGEPFAGTTDFGEGDYNGDGVTNAEVAAAVIGAGGDVDDFIAGATGDFGPFWDGNPALPLGVVVLGGLLGALAVGGVEAARRNKK
jgi:hypothetical protein